jgi:hypothetical protein
MSKFSDYMDNRREQRRMKRILTEEDHYMF